MKGRGTSQNTSENKHMQYIQNIPDIKYQNTSFENKHIQYTQNISGIKYLTFASRIKLFIFWLDILGILKFKPKYRTNITRS